MCVCVGGYPSLRVGVLCFNGVYTCVCGWGGGVYVYMCTLL